MIQVILLNSHVIIVESKDISRLNVLMLTKRRKRLMIGKRRKHGKERRAYIAWEDNDDSTSTSSQEGSEEANLCLMAGYESSSSS